MTHADTGGNPVDVFLTRYYPAVVTTFIHFIDDTQKLGAVPVGLQRVVRRLPTLPATEGHTGPCSPAFHSGTLRSCSSRSRSTMST